MSSTSTSRTFARRSTDRSAAMTSRPSAGSGTGSGAPRDRSVPIRVRLALAFALVALVLVVVGGLLFERSFHSGLRSSLAPGLRRQAAATALAFRDQFDRGIAALQVVNAGDDVAQLLDSNGRVLVTTKEAGRRPIVDAETVHRAQRRATFGDATLDAEQEPFRVLANPDQSGRVLVVATSLEPTNSAVSRVRNALLIGGAIAVVLAGLGGWVLAAAALRPVERMRRKAADITEHDVRARLPVPATHDELQALATTMNVLLAELQDALQRQRAFVADAGHELRTPLSVLRTELELAGRPTRTRDELRDAVGQAARETNRLERLAEGLLFLAKRDEGTEARFETTALQPMLEAAIDAGQRRAQEQHRADQQHVPLELDTAASVTARAAPSLLRPAVDNLIGNALRHSSPRSKITVRLRNGDASAVIEVLDEGPGFPPEFLDHAFERFSRGDSARSRAGGAGLGLAIVRAVAEVHGGSAEAANRPEGGAVVTIRIPRL